MRPSAVHGLSLTLVERQASKASRATTATPGAQNPPELLDTCERVRPLHVRVDRVGMIERRGSKRQGRDVCAREVQATRVDEIGKRLSSLSSHVRGEINRVEVPGLVEPCNGARDCGATAEAQLEHPLLAA